MASRAGWTITDHVCQVCFGRILSRAIAVTEDNPDPGRTFRCADCGVEKVGASSAVVCMCGFKIAGRKNLGARCEPNSERTPEFPAEIIARQP